jgi:ankyrin repeat protein
LRLFHRRCPGAAFSNSGIVIFFLVIFLSGTLHAGDYNWDLVNALVQNDFGKIENIIKENIDTMSVTDKRLMVNFALTYSHGENTIRTLDLLQKYNIQPYSFDLYTAVNRNQPAGVIQQLLRIGVEPNGEILLLAMEKQRFDLAKQFIETGVDVNYRYPLTRSYADGMTALLYASKWENFDLVKLLVDSGADINARSKDGNTALSTARMNNNDRICNFLLERGAAETPDNFILPGQQGSGISGMLDNQLNSFQNGTYQLSGSNVYIRFLGNANSGAINYTSNGRTYIGVYRPGSNNLTLVIEGHTFVYKIDSNISFSGNGEMWLRVGN